MFTFAILILFWLMLAGNMITAIMFGETIEKGFAGTLCVISFVVFAIGLVVAPAIWASIGFASDIAILMLALVLVARTDRYWPVWFAAMQSLSVGTNLVALFVDGVPHLIFSNLAAVWALPALMTMSWGTIRDWRARQPTPASTPARAATG